MSSLLHKNRILSSQHTLILILAWANGFDKRAMIFHLQCTSLSSLMQCRSLFSLRCFNKHWILKHLFKYLRRLLHLSLLVVVTKQSQPIVKLDFLALFFFSSHTPQHDIMPLIQYGWPHYIDLRSSHLSEENTIASY